MRGNPTVMLFGHGGSGNRGCEALARSTANILYKAFEGEVHLTLASFRIDEDIRVGIPYISDYVSHCRNLRRWTPDWVRFVFHSKIMHNYISAYRFLHRGAVNYGQRADISLSIGGDNYCYGPPCWLYVIDRDIKAAGKKLVLWGASIEPSLIDDQMEQDLRLFDLITARESITYEALGNRGGRIKAYLYPDPAFIMDKEELPLPPQWEEGDTIGINVSPLITKYERQSGLVLSSVYALMKHILETTRSNIALIPHVIRASDNDNDLKPLRSLYDEFAYTSRVVLIGDIHNSPLNAPQLKGFISRCRLFIGARTHSTIAAYSTCVPTLALGYSVKARGIARDIFGTESLVLPVQRLSSEKDLVNSFEELRERENELREHMRKVMPSYIKAAWQAGELVRELVA